MRLDVIQGAPVDLNYSVEGRGHTLKFFFVPASGPDVVALRDIKHLLEYIHERPHLSVHEAAGEWSRIRAQEGP